MLSCWFLQYEAKGDCMNALSFSRFGRVLLHVICLLRNPANLHWHSDGILREFHVQRRNPRLLS
jgi:hypothetical protein